MFFKHLMLYKFLCQISPFYMKELFVLFWPLHLKCGGLYRKLYKIENVYVHVFDTSYVLIVFV